MSSLRMLLASALGWGFMAELWQDVGFQGPPPNCRGGTGQAHRWLVVRNISLPIHVL